jgi:hypothetical protein
MQPHNAGSEWRNRNTTPTDETYAYMGENVSKKDMFDWLRANSNLSVSVLSV